MNIVPAVECAFEVTFDQPGLFAAMSVYDVSNLIPALVQGPSAMDNVIANTYMGKFTPTVGKLYLVLKAVYTDGTYSAINTDFPQGSETVYAGVVGTPAPIINQVVSIDLAGELEDSNGLVGFLEGGEEEVGGLIESQDELA